MNRSLMLMAVSIVIGMLGCDALRDYPKKIQEFPEPWKVLEPGTPRERFPTPRVITEGDGPTVAPGDLVQLQIRNKWVDEGTWHERGNWWVWVGFRTSSDTSFFSTEPRVASALLGLREGAVLEFIEAGDQPGTDSRIAGTLLANVFGDPQNYFWRKGNQGDANIYVTSSGTPSQIDIKLVCKGQTKYRTVRLFDDSPVQVCSGLNCRVTTEAREAWIDEARIDAVCKDGKKVSFQYGPIGSRNGKEGRSPKRGYFDEWLLKAWGKLTTGVQFEGNHPPEATDESRPAQRGLPSRS